MKKIKFSIYPIIILFVFFSCSENNVNYYGIKSGMVTYETYWAHDGKKDSTIDLILYFDDYGNKLRIDALDEKGRIVESQWFLNDTLYRAILPDYTKTLQVFKNHPKDFFRISFKEDSLVYKRIPGQIVAGKQSDESYLRKTEIDSITLKQIGWKNIPLIKEFLLTVVTSGIKAIEIRETNVSDQKFILPKYKRIYN